MLPCKEIAVRSSFGSAGRRVPRDGAVDLTVRTGRTSISPGAKSWTPRLEGLGQAFRDSA